MKIIHFADLHIGSKFERMPEDIKNELNTKLRNALTKIIEYSKENNITTILMSGDIFDKNSVIMKDKKFFYDTIRTNSEIDFYYIKGNHDSSSKYNDNIGNLHTFNEIKSYIKDNIRIIGYELSDNNESLYNVAPFTTDKFNIMMLHGDIKNKKDSNYIDLKKLQNKNINYFALGHIHKREEGVVGESKYAYPGCVLGRGFDETGEKGFLVLDTETNTIVFYDLADILFEHIDIQVNGLNEAELKNEISTKIGSANHSYITEIRLIGKSDLEIDVNDLEISFKDKRRYLTIKNASKQALNFIPNKNENSLRSMFINKVLNNPNLDDDIKEKVISYGLSKLVREDD